MILLGGRAGEDLGWRKAGQGRKRLQEKGRATVTDGRGRTVAGGIITVFGLTQRPSDLDRSDANSTMGAELTGVTGSQVESANQRVRAFLRRVVLWSGAVDQGRGRVGVAWGGHGAQGRSSRFRW